MENKFRITLKTGWWGYATTMLIILVRAFRPNAEPMEEWSVASWFAMFAPILFPWYAYFACWAIYLGGMGLLWICRGIYASWNWIMGRN